MAETKPKIDRDLCIGCGLCESLYPEVFKLNDNFKAEIVGDAKDEKKLQEVIDSCPTKAISRPPPTPNLTNQTHDSNPVLAN